MPVLQDHGNPDIDLFSDPVVYGFRQKTCSGVKLTLNWVKVFSKEENQQEGKIYHLVI